MKRAKPLSRQLSDHGQATKARKSSLDKEAADGWTVFSDKEKHLAYEYNTNVQANALSKLARSSTPCDVFCHFLNEELIEAVLRRVNADDTLALVNKGCRLHRYVFTVEEVYQYLAVRVFIQAVSTEKAPTVDQAIKKAMDILGFDGFVKIRLLHTRFVVQIGTPEEEMLSKTFSKALRTLGEVVSGDEKLFRHTGQSCFVRLCPNKPAKVGIWNYQLCCRLANGKSFLVWTKTHMTPPNSGLRVGTDHIVRHWAEHIKAKSTSPCVLVFDSYYFSKASVDVLMKENVKFIAAVSPARAGCLVPLLSPQVEKKGDSAFAFNTETNESACLHWSTDPKVGKKMVYSNAFFCKANAPQTPNVPLYHEYKFCFSLCDHFNHALAGKQFPYKMGGGHEGADLMAGWNYLFSCVLVNAWSMYSDIAGEDVQYKVFCEKLVNELKEKKGK